MEGWCKYTEQVVLDSWQQVVLYLGGSEFYEISHQDSDL